MEFTWLGSAPLSEVALFSTGCEQEAWAKWQITACDIQLENACFSEAAILDNIRSAFLLSLLPPPWKKKKKEKIISPRELVVGIFSEKQCQPEKDDFWVAGFAE